MCEIIPRGYAYYATSIIHRSLGFERIPRVLCGRVAFRLDLILLLLLLAAMVMMVIW